MKNAIKLFGIIAIVAVIGFSFTACGGDDDGNGNGDAYDPNLGSGNIGKTGPGGGKIFYYSATGFTVTGNNSFTAHYLEAAPVNQGTSIPWASENDEVTGTETGIGTGKNNTAIIIATFSSDNVTGNASKACAAYSNNGKNDWFLPSKDELNELYNARSHVGGLYGNFYSSSQGNSTGGEYGLGAWAQSFVDGQQVSAVKYTSGINARAIRAF